MSHMIKNRLKKMDCFLGSKYNTASLPLPILTLFLLVPCCIAYLLQLSSIISHEVEHGYVKL